MFYQQCTNNTFNLNMALRLTKYWLDFTGLPNVCSFKPHRSMMIAQQWLYNKQQLIWLPKSTLVNKGVVLMFICSSFLLYLRWILINNLRICILKCIWLQSHCPQSTINSYLNNEMKHGVKISVSNIRWILLKWSVEYWNFSDVPTESWFSTYCVHAT